MKKLTNFSLLAFVVTVLLVFSIEAVQAGPCERPEFNKENFSAPQDNPYLPQSVIGWTYVYEADDEDGTIVNYIQFTEDTHLLTALGFSAIVVYDAEYLRLEDGTHIKLEETWDWHAWDNFGNFWYFGEETTEYEYNDDWQLIDCNNDGSWEAGKDVAGVGSIAEPGIILPAVPRQGDCYEQEYYEDEAEDVGKVLKVNATCEDLDGLESEECMRMKEWTGLEPGNVEQKTYYPGLGLVNIKELKEKTVEVLLIDINGNGVPNLDEPNCSAIP